MAEPCVTVDYISEDECIGESLPKINNNFASLSSAVCSLSGEVYNTGIRGIANTPTISLELDGFRTLRANVITIPIASGGTGAVTETAARSNLDAQQTIIGAATTIARNNLDASKVVITNSSGKIAASTVNSADLDFLQGMNVNLGGSTNLTQLLAGKVTKTGDSMSGALTLSLAAADNNGTNSAIRISSATKPGISFSNLNFNRSVNLILPDSSSSVLCLGGGYLGNTFYQIWHAGNQGNGSGLDADTVKGFVPIQQGGGTSQLGNKVFIGWMGSQLGLQVDSTNFAGTWPLNISGNAAGLSNTLGVAGGGTGGTTAAAARTNLDAQQTITGTASTITSTNLAADRVLITDANGKAAVSSVTSTTLANIGTALANAAGSSVQKTGDSMSGALTLNLAAGGYGSNNALRISSGADPGISFTQLNTGRTMNLFVPGGADGELSIGGGSYGNNFYNIWHAGNFAPSNYLFRGGGTMWGDLTISKDAPTIKFDDNETPHWIHVNSNIFYVLSDRNRDGGWEGPFPLVLNSSNNTAQIFGSTVWRADNDGAGSGLDADTIDGIESSDLFRFSQDQTNYARKAFASANANVNDSRATLNSLEVIGQGGAAMLTFHRPGAFAGYLGLDSDNQFKIGGWSFGGNSYPILHTGNVNNHIRPKPYFSVRNSNSFTVSQINGFSRANSSAADTWGYLFVSPFKWDSEYRVTFSVSYSIVSATQSRFEVYRSVVLQDCMTEALSYNTASAVSVANTSLTIAIPRSQHTLNVGERILFNWANSSVQSRGRITSITDTHIIATAGNLNRTSFGTVYCYRLIKPGHGLSETDMIKVFIGNNTIDDGADRYVAGTTANTFQLFTDVNRTLFDSFTSNNISTTIKIYYGASSETLLGQTIEDETVKVMHTATGTFWDKPNFGIASNRRFLYEFNGLVNASTRATAFIAPFVRLTTNDSTNHVYVSTNGFDMGHASATTTRALNQCILCVEELY